MLNIVLFGAPGCGKGTQAARLKEKYGIDHVSTGNVIREEIARGTKLGKEMESYITTGRLAPDQVVIDMIADYIAAHKHAKGNIFDGFPRTTHQAEEFDRMLSEQGLKVDVMIYMDVPEEELVKRILLRGKESGRADDASEESRCFVPFRKKNFPRSPRKTRLAPDTPDKRHAPPSFRPNAPAPTVPVGKQPGGSGTENIPIYINKSCRR